MKTEITRKEKKNIRKLKQISWQSTKYTIKIRRKKIQIFINCEVRMGERRTNHMKDEFPMNFEW